MRGRGVDKGKRDSARIIQTATESRRAARRHAALAIHPCGLPPPAVRSYAYEASATGIGVVSRIGLDGNAADVSIIPYDTARASSAVR